MGNGWTDLGKKNNVETAQPSGNDKESKSYPYLSIERDKPSGMKLGDTIECMVKLKLTGETTRKEKDGEKVTCSYDVLAIKDGGHEDKEMKMKKKMFGKYHEI